MTSSHAIVSLAPPSGPGPPGMHRLEPRDRPDARDAILSVMPTSPSADGLRRGVHAQGPAAAARHHRGRGERRDLSKIDLLPRSPPGAARAAAAPAVLLDRRHRPRHRSQRRDARVGRRGPRYSAVVVVRRAAAPEAPRAHGAGVGAVLLSRGQPARLRVRRLLRGDLGRRCRRVRRARGRAD